jgi:ACS family hexuronate transporter-like MFS transporter
LVDFLEIILRNSTKHPKLSQEELEFINSDADEQEVETTESVKWIKLFGIRQTWAFVFGKMFTDPIWWFFLYWLPSYFAERFQLDLKKPSIELIVVYTATTIGSIGGDTYRVTLSRKVGLYLRQEKHPC